MKRFIGILQFLTRIPININIGFDEEFHKSIIYFPLVGLILGILYFAIGFVSLKIFNIYIVSTIILMSEVLLTGGLHLDGVCDTFDGIYSYRDKDRILEIMKDSRLGTNAVLAMIFLILLKVGFIFVILKSNLLWLIIFMPVLGRMSLASACYKTITPREKGMGNLFIGKATTGMITTIYLYTISIIAFISTIIFKTDITVVLKIVGFIVVNYIFVKLFIKSIYKKIDGITGDILGCICELSQLLYLIYICLILNLR